MANTFMYPYTSRAFPTRSSIIGSCSASSPRRSSTTTRSSSCKIRPSFFSLSVGGEPGKLSHLGIRYPGTGDVASEMVRVKSTGVPLFQQEGTTCCYAKADKFWVADADGIPWEMYTLLEDVEAETAADSQLRNFLGQERRATEAQPAASDVVGPESACGVDCCVPSEAKTA